MTDAGWTQIGLGVALGGKIAYDILKDISERRREEQKRKDERLDREQDRLDRAQLAQLTLSQLEAVKSSGDVRLRKIVNEVQEVKKVTIAGIRASKEAIEIANGHNEKIATAVDLSQKVLSRLETPQKVEVINTPEHPVPIQQAE